MATSKTYLYALILAAICIAAAPITGVAKPVALPRAVADDVSESYHLLLTSAYKPVSPQTLLDAARAALLREARRHRVNVALAKLTAASDSTYAVARLNGEIERAAAAAHGAPTDYAYAAMAGMANALRDRWTEFMTPTMFAQFSQELDPRSISGIGVMIESDPRTHYIRASYVVPETPADRAGIRPGDEFLRIDGSSTKNMTSAAASALLRGKPGAAVRLSVLSPQRSLERHLTIVRSDIMPPTVVFAMLPHDIGYVHVLSFGLTTATEFDTAIERLQDEGMHALALDLRNDGGGYVETALQISSRLIADKPIVTIENRNSQPQTMDAQGAAALGLPLVVLVNADTASASEITAGALQDDGAGILVGVKTFGKGVMQTLTPLPDGSAIKITTAHYLTPNNHDINLRGIRPNVRVRENRFPRFGELADDAQLRMALKLLQKKIADASHPALR